MTIENIFLLVAEYQTLLIGLMLVAPWLSWLICVVVPGKAEEPLVLSINLGFALICLLGELGYLAYATQAGGWTKVVKEADFLLLLAPFYYLGISLWLSQQRVSLSQLPPVRLIKGLGLILAAYLMLSWIIAQIRIVIFSYLPFAWFLLIILSLLSLGYLGYLQLTNLANFSKKEVNKNQKSSRSKLFVDDDIETELERLRKSSNEKRI